MIYEGGAIQVTFGASLDISGTSFDRNSAGNDGGAIFVEDGRVKISGCTFLVRVQELSKGGCT